MHGRLEDDEYRDEEGKERRISRGKRKQVEKEVKRGLLWIGAFGVLNLGTSGLGPRNGNTDSIGPL